MKTAHKITYWVLLTLISIGFIAAAIPKITGDPMAIAGFAHAHLPVWFMYFIGYAEILGAIGLWIRKCSLSDYAAYGLWIILAGATITSLIFGPSGTALIPVVYAIILGIIFYLRTSQK